MREWLVVATEYAVLAIDALALLIIVYGTAEAFISGLHLVFSSPSAAVAVIRTFLNFFLERDLAEVRERQHETES